MESGKPLNLEFSTLDRLRLAKGVKSVYTYPSARHRGETNEQPDNVDGSQSRQAHHAHDSALQEADYHLSNSLAGERDSAHSLLHLRLPGACTSPHMLSEAEGQTRACPGSSAQLRRGARRPQPREVQSGASAGRNRKTSKSRDDAWRSRFPSVRSARIGHRPGGALGPRDKHCDGTEQSRITFGPGDLKIATAIEVERGASSSGPQPAVDGADEPERRRGSGTREHLAGGPGRWLHKRPRPRPAHHLLTRISVWAAGAVVPLSHRLVVLVTAEGYPGLRKRGNPQGF